jgi:NAD(P)-dependent dehydrogenase (short-subunit alcohol dehydrogenase family)
MAEIVLKLSGKVALITGGSSGIGLASAQLMHEHGAQVVIVGRDAKKLSEAVKLIGLQASAVAADISKLEDIDRVMSVVSARYGRIDVLLVNAGTSHSPPLREVDESVFDTMIDLNFKGAFFTVQRALPLLAAEASVILTGSAAADLGRWGDPLYAASKAAVRSLARTFANDEAMALRQVRFNVLSPGAVKTPLTQLAYEQPDVDAYVCAAVPLKRWGAAEEIARAALFLACSDSSYMTGSVLAIDGGMAQV